MLLGPVTPAGEQLRLIRARLATLQRERALKVVLVTSSVPAEGKTFVASSLAGILAREAQNRVLLIDADLRTGNAGRTLGVSHDPAGGGLADFLRDQTNTYPVERSILHCSDCNLHFLPAGKYAHDAVELLGSRKLEGLLRSLAQSFDWIVIDSTPVLDLADANLLVPLCDATLLVARARKTPTKLIQNSIERIGKQHTTGILLNQVRPIGSRAYYRSHYGHYRRMSKTAAM
jgi:capsular exopolysaccharide synthesis family protein